MILPKETTEMRSTKVKQSVSEWTEYESLRLTTPRFSKKYGVSKFPRLTKIESEKQLTSFRKSKLMSTPGSGPQSGRKQELSTFTPRMRAPPTLIIKFRPDGGKSGA